MLYLDSANTDDLKRAMELGIIKGVTTNPTILYKERVKQTEKINEILQLTTGDVFVQTEGVSEEDILTDADRILSTFNNGRIALKIPAHLAGVSAIAKVRERYPSVKILATAIYSTDQGLLAALAGSHFIAPYINRMENNNIDPYKVVADTAKIYKERKLDTQILGASFKNTNQVIQTLASGAHTATVSYDMIEQMANKELALSAIDVFNQDARRLDEEGGSLHG